MKINVVTLFSGYDSQCLALDRLKRDFPDFDYELVAWSEIDRFAIQAHNALYPQWAERNLGDVCKIDWRSFAPQIDLLTYSFPCTDISPAGQQKGLSRGGGTRSSLLWECERCIQMKKPWVLLMENVKALTQKKFMPDFLEWQRMLEDYGYRNFWKVLNAKDYGIPQNRERVFMLSFLDGSDYRFPNGFALDLTLEDMLEDGVEQGFYLSQERIDGLLRSTLEEMKKRNGFKFKVKKKSDIANALTSKCGGGAGRPTTLSPSK